MVSMYYCTRKVYWRILTLHPLYPITPYSPPLPFLPCLRPALPPELPPQGPPPSTTVHHRPRRPPRPRSPGADQRRTVGHVPGEAAPALAYHKPRNTRRAPPRPDHPGSAPATIRPACPGTQALMHSCTTPRAAHASLFRAQKTPPTACRAPRLDHRQDARRDRRNRPKPPRRKNFFVPAIHCAATVCGLRRVWLEKNLQKSA